MIFWSAMDTALKSFQESTICLSSTYSWLSSLHCMYIFSVMIFTLYSVTSPSLNSKLYTWESSRELLWDHLIQAKLLSHFQDSIQAVTIFCHGTLPKRQHNCQATLVWLHPYLAHVLVGPQCHLHIFPWVGISQSGSGSKSFKDIPSPQRALIASSKMPHAPLFTPASSIHQRSVPVCEVKDNLSVGL